MSKIDRETALRIAREAAARVVFCQDRPKYAHKITLGHFDDGVEVQSAYLALTRGADLLKPTEPPEVTAARKVLEDWQRKQEGK
jgi:hypothetical protein